MCGLALSAYFLCCFRVFPLANIVFSSCCKQNVRTVFIRCECNSTVRKYTSNWIEIDTNRKSIETGHFEHVSIAVHFYKCQFNCNRPRKQSMYPVRFHEVFKYLPANEQARENEANGWKKKKTRTKTKIPEKKSNFSIRVHNFQYHFHTFATIAAGSAYWPLDNVCWSNSNDFHHLFLSIFACFYCWFAFPSIAFLHLFFSLFPP